MVTNLLDYQLNDVNVASSDGSHAVVVTGATKVAGPGAIGGLTLNDALRFGGSASASVGVADVAFDARRFHVRVVFRVDASFNGRENLVESDRLPFAVFVEGEAGAGIALRVSTKPTSHGWRATTTESPTKVKVGQWHTADLVYDMDTLGCFLDGDVVALQAFPKGKISLARTGKLYIGSWVDGQRNRFSGTMALVAVNADIPAELESDLDAARSRADWFITRKANQLLKTLNLGKPTEPARLRPAIGAWYQRWTHGAFMYHPSAGSAFEIHGAIYQRYQNIREADRLGFLVSDEAKATRASGRKSIFSKGAIYWSGPTGAIDVDGQLYLDYENLGESRALGFPIEPIRNIAGGRMLRLERANMYHRDGAPAAHEVHGEILKQFLATGGISKWGFPVSDELPVKKGSQTVGRSSEFEGCTFYWSSRTGAHEVHGDVRRKYHDRGGATGEFGFPITNEQSISGVAGARVSGFEKGSICWYGSWGNTTCVYPFKLFLGTLNTDESEGFAMGQNDLYVKITIKNGSQTLHQKKYPPSGDWGGRNVRDVNINFPPTIIPDPSKRVTFIVDVWESDGGAPFGGGDDHIGKWTKMLDASNAWGMRGTNGILDSGSFRKVNNIRASVKPQIDTRSLTEPEKFCGVKNKKTPTIPWALYANAFRDVDSDTEWWDVTDWLDGAFYELVAKGVASGGNCFGMSLEAIYARKNLSPFSLPLDRFKTWDQLKPNFNVKHQYQVGAAAIWWFLGEFVTGNTHDPVDVFNETRAAASRGDHPVMCISQNWDFSGAPHCILPVTWDKSSTPWRIGVLDPNFPNQLRTLFVNPSNNRYSYDGGSNDYSGGEWTGGRLHYMPWSVLCRAPRTPVWDAIVLLLTGVIIILASGHETDKITDPDGNDLDAHGNRAKDLLKANGHLDGYFMTYKGFDGGGVIPGEVLLSMGTASRNFVSGGAVIDPGVLVNATVSDFEANRDLRRIRDVILANQPAGTTTVANATLGNIAGSATTMATLSSAARDVLLGALQVRRPGDYRHQIRATGNGSLKYAMKNGLSEFRIDGNTRTGQVSKIRAKDIGSRAAEFAVQTDRAGQLDVGVAQKLGVAGDDVRVELTRLPVTSGDELIIDAKPGLGALDIAAPGGPTNVGVTVVHTLDGRETRRQFNIDIDGAARLTTAPSQSDGVVAVSRIERIRGPVLGTVIVDANP